MEYARQEVRFASGGWSGGPLVTGIVTASGAPGARPLPVRGLVVRATGGATVIATHTLLGHLKRRDTLPSPAQAVGDARSALQEGATRLVGGIPVRHGAVRVGKLTAVWCDRATGQVMHVLMRPSGGLFGRKPERVALASQFVAWTDKGLALADATDFAALPPYLPDATIDATTRAALSGVLLSPSARHAVKLRVEDGEVFLGGTVETDEQVTAARRAVERVRGVRGLVMDLVASESIGARVEQALAATLAATQASTGDDAPAGTPGDARTGLGAVKVLSEHGIVYLEGSAPTKELSSALERAAKGVPGVHLVINSLAIEVGAPHLPTPAPGSPQPDQPGGETANSTLVRARNTTVRLPTPH